MRSRVTPGLSSTMEIFSPASLLNNVDFPTFGRPTMATSGRDVCLLIIYLVLIYRFPAVLIHHDTPCRNRCGARGSNARTGVSRTGTFIGAGGTNVSLKEAYRRHFQASVHHSTKILRLCKPAAPVHMEDTACSPAPRKMPHPFPGRYRTCSPGGLPL